MDALAKTGKCAKRIVVNVHVGCGQRTQLVGVTTKRQLPVYMCPRCDGSFLKCA